MSAFDKPGTEMCLKAPWEEGTLAVTGILDRIDSPSGLKNLSFPQLEELAAEIRREMIRVVSLNGGHLASSLGTVELTIALHRVFNSPEDKIVWDVGHQSYTHKLLTGRRSSFATLRRLGGLSGFPAPWESPHDAFVAGHSGNSISAALGMVLAGELNCSHNHVIAVIGDGSLGSGMAFEAVNHAGHLGKKLIVVLNDNGMSISPSIGALSRLFNQVKLDTRYTGAKRRARNFFKYLPFGQPALAFSSRIKHRLERALLPNAFWEEMGFDYLGPLDGHNIREMETALIRARDLETRPTLVHVLTQKGKGCPEAESDVVKYHGISPSGVTKPSAPSYSQVFGQTVRRLMRENGKVVVISAAMLDGTGLAPAALEFPERVFDVGICEQHAVTLAAGLASRGCIPLVAVYSTFLQRAYDQIIHDVCLPGLPVIFAVDRAGIVGEDGQTHQGSFDLSFLRCLPGMTLASPADEKELRDMLYSAVSYRSPIAIRYPRDCGRGIDLPEAFSPVAPGKSEKIREGKDLALLAIGPLVQPSLEAAERLAGEGLDCSVINARFAKPLDSGLILAEAEKTRRLLTLEENTLCGGFGSAVLELFAAHNIKGVKVKCLGLPDSFIEHGDRDLLCSLNKLDSAGIAQTVRAYFPELILPLSSRAGEEP
jgi:1-deoxy-D-xylulose-5-phosphate synthase